MKRKQILVGPPIAEDTNTVGYSDGKVVLKKDQIYYFDSSESNDLSVKVVNVLASNILDTKNWDENSSTQISIPSTERGKL